SASIAAGLEGWAWPSALFSSFSGALTAFSSACDDGDASAFPRSHPRRQPETFAPDRARASSFELARAGQKDAERYHLHRGLYLRGGRQRGCDADVAVL